VVTLFKASPCQSHGPNRCKNSIVGSRTLKITVRGVSGLRRCGKASPLPIFEYLYPESNGTGYRCQHFACLWITPWGVTTGEIFRWCKNFLLRREAGHFFARRFYDFRPSLVQRRKEFIARKTRAEASKFEQLALYKLALKCARRSPRETSPFSVGD
jgi:hypothetical protein